MKKIFNHYRMTGVAYEPPVCELRRLESQMPVVASYSIPEITEEEEDWQ
ncbi:MAG: hypothetical protein IJS62_02815 [Bacteroidales bacterium]|nr:hypothetical protein [Bacteroidales bacterium]